jgi:hypothetical protein
VGRAGSTAPLPSVPHHADGAEAQGSRCHARGNDWSPDTARRPCPHRRAPPLPLAGPPFCLTRVALPHKLLPVRHAFQQEAAAKQEQPRRQRGAGAQGTRHGRRAAAQTHRETRGGGQVGLARASCAGRCTQPAPPRYHNAPQRVSGGDRQHAGPGP